MRRERGKTLPFRFFDGKEGYNKQGKKKFFFFLVAKGPFWAFYFTKRENISHKGGRKMEELKKWVISVLLYLF